MISMPEMLLVALLALLFFGANRIENLASSLGRSINAFKKGLREVDAPPPGKSAPDDKSPGGQIPPHTLNK